MWTENENKLYKKFRFKNFSEAFAFITRVALLAEKMDHHPQWTNVYNTVEIWLSTHDAGDVITDKDRKLANAIDAITGNDKTTVNDTTTENESDNQQEVTYQLD